MVLTTHNPQCWELFLGSPYHLHTGVARSKRQAQPEQVMANGTPTRIWSVPGSSGDKYDRCGDRNQVSRREDFWGFATYVKRPLGPLDDVSDE